MVRTEARYSPRASSCAKTWRGVSSTNSGLLSTSRIFSRSGVVSARAGDGRAWVTFSDRACGGRWWR